METITSSKGISRRELLKRCMVVGAGLAVGTGFRGRKHCRLGNGNEARRREKWRHLYRCRETFIRMTMSQISITRQPLRDLTLPTRRTRSRKGVSALDVAAQGRGYADYLSVPWEIERVEILRSMEQSSFFQTMRGNLITGLYNKKEVWPLFGYEGESYSKGGYMNRGFDDITWI